MLAFFSVLIWGLRLIALLAWIAVLSVFVLRGRGFTRSRTFKPVGPIRPSSSQLSPPASSLALLDQPRQASGHSG